jgi:hypothetical protein
MPCSVWAKGEEIENVFEGFLCLVLTKRVRATTNEKNSRTSAYETLATLAGTAPKDVLPVVSNLTSVVLERAEQLASMQDQLVGLDDRNNYSELQVNFLSVLTVRGGERFVAAQFRS